MQPIHNNTIQAQLYALGFRPTRTLPAEPHWLYLNGSPYLNGKGRNANKRKTKITEEQAMIASLRKRHSGKATFSDSRTTSNVASVAM